MGIFRIPGPSEFTSGGPGVRAVGVAVKAVSVVIGPPCLRITLTMARPERHCGAVPAGIRHQFWVRVPANDQGSLASGYRSASWPA